MWKYAAPSQKIQVLLRFVKEYGARDPVGLGVVFSIFNEIAVIERGIFLNNLSFNSGEPLLVIGYDEVKAPTTFTYQDIEYKKAYDIFITLFRFNPYYIYMNFPEKKLPPWYMQISEPRPGQKTSFLAKQAVTPPNRHVLYDVEIDNIYKEAYMALINSALELGNKNQFIALTQKLKSIN